MNLKIVTETLLAKRWVAASWAPIPLRLIVGFGFVAHGYAKLVKGPYVFVGILSLGVPAPYFMAWLMILIAVQRWPERLNVSESAPTRARLRAQVASRLNQLRDTNLRPR
jgi:hypothetical protein